VAQQIGVQYDDLVQEGLIDVWRSLARGVAPRTDMIENRMRDYVRFEGTQVGRGRTGEPLAYDELLPLDERVEAVRG